MCIFFHSHNVYLTHNGSAKVSVIKCFVLVKMYGNSPRKLFVRVMRNGEVKMNEFALFSFPFLCIVFISLYSLLVVLLLCYFVMGFIKFMLGSVVLQ
jgi:hypothetical protein